MGALPPSGVHGKGVDLDEGPGKGRIPTQRSTQEQGPTA